MSCVASRRVTSRPDGVVIYIPVVVFIALVLLGLLDSDALSGCLTVIAVVVGVPATAIVAWLVLEVVVETFGVPFPGADDVLFGASR